MLTGPIWVRRAWRNGVPGDDVDPCERGCLVPFGIDVDENGEASFSDGGEDVEDGGFRPTMPRLAPAWREERVHDAFGRVVRIIYELEGPFGMAWSVGVQRVWDGSRLLHERTSSGCLQRVWAPGVLLDRPLAYAVSLEPACMEKFDDPQEEMEALFAMMAEGSAMDLDLSIFDDEDVRVFTLLKDLRQDVLAVLDEEGEVLEKVRNHASSSYRGGPGCRCCSILLVLMATTVTSCGAVGTGGRGCELTLPAVCEDERVRCRCVVDTLTIEPNLRHRMWHGPDTIPDIDLTITDVPARELVITGFRFHGDLVVLNVASERMQLTNIEVRRIGRGGGVWIEQSQVGTVVIGPNVASDYITLGTVEADSLLLMAIPDLVFLSISQTVVNSGTRLDGVRICQLLVHWSSSLGSVEVAGSMIDWITVSRSIHSESTEQWIDPEDVVPDEAWSDRCVVTLSH